MNKKTTLKDMAFIEKGGGHLNKEEIGRSADFFIKIVMMFSTIIALLISIRFYPVHAVTILVIMLLFLIAIIVKGITSMMGEKK